MKIIIYLFIAICILFFIYIIYVKTTNNNINNINNGKEPFLVKNAENDGKMTFDYLHNPNYAKRILSKYYVNDDVIINGKRVVQHPYQIRHTPDGRSYYYGDSYNIWGAGTRWSDAFYKWLGMRL